MGSSRIRSSELIDIVRESASKCVADCKEYHQLAMKSSQAKEVQHMLQACASRYGSIAGQAYLLKQLSESSSSFKTFEQIKISFTESDRQQAFNYMNEIAGRLSELRRDKG